MSVDPVEPLLSARDLEKRYPVGSGAFGKADTFAAVDGVSFDVGRGETLGLVGESGSGKSTTGRILLRLEEPTRGDVRFDGEDWLALEGEELRQRRRHLQIVFQDPQTSLNPRMTCGAQVGEPLRVHRLARGRELADRVDALLSEVGLSAETARRFPAELSGGQRQRVAIARALVTKPALLLADEPTGNLDSATGAEVLALFDGLHASGNTIVLVTHESGIARRTERTIYLRDGLIVGDTQNAGGADDAA